MKDDLTRFIFEDLPVRGEHVYLQDAWREILARRNYPKNVRKLLGELIAATALLGATVKIEGKITVQVQAQGALSLLVVQLDSKGGLRALAKHSANPKGNSLRELCGAGQLVITLESKHSNKPYQGVIPLIDDSIKAAIERYFETSEQLPTRIELAADDNALAGFFIQKLPTNQQDILDENVKEGFERIVHLSSTLSTKELLELEPAEILQRLFHEEHVRIFEPQALYFKCQCSTERTLAMVMQFKEDERQEMLQEGAGMISVDCEFCGKTYKFDNTDLNAPQKETQKETQDSVFNTPSSTTRH